MTRSWAVPLLSIALALQARGADADPQTTARRVLARFRHEPTVAAVQRAAIRAARLEVDESDSWRSRVNLAPLLPEIRIRAYHALDRDESLLLEPGRADRLDLDAGEGWRLEGRAGWDLARLVWDRSEVDIGREAAARGKRRNEIVRTVARLYFERRRRQVTRILRPPSDVVEAAEAEMEVRELTAVLDGLTGGWYAARLREDGGRR